jgi:pyruvate ferredoxin oxidoreductase gamma subunit
MHRIRFHGRGGQGMKTASRILGTSLFLTGFEVQDAPRYGAERRGAPISAYVRADHEPILERGLIERPDLVVVADDSLVGVPVAGVLHGLAENGVLFIITTHSADEWKNRLGDAISPDKIVVLPPPEGFADDPSLLSACAAGAAACLVGAVSRDLLKEAVAQELAVFPEPIRQANLSRALAAYDVLADLAGMASGSAEGGPAQESEVAWIDLPHDRVRLAAPNIDAGATSVRVRTGLWRTMRPIIDHEKCRKCTWVCGSYCPDGVITIGSDGFPLIDYEHCKGCMICLVQCPTHAIFAVAEAEAERTDREGEEVSA